MASMRPTPDALSNKQELSLLMEGEYITWVRKSLQLTRGMTIYPETLTPEQQHRLNGIEQELLKMAYKPEEETRTVLKGK